MSLGLRDRLEKSENIKIKIICRIIPVFKQHIKKAEPVLSLAAAVLLLALHHTLGVIVDADGTTA